MIIKKQNPQMPEAPLTRQIRARKLVEGEDFVARCPSWCIPVPDGAWPTERGWYLAVSLLQTTDDSPVEAEPVWLEFQSWAEEQRGDGWLVNEIGSDHAAARRDFYWVGKMEMPSVAMEDQT